METLRKNSCQRCRVTIHRLADFGSNIDGSVNTEYCHNCYSRGEYVNKGIVMSENAEKNMATL